MAPIAVAQILMLCTAAFSLNAIVREVDRSDATRAKEAVTAAFNYQLGRLEMVTLNNAVYTEAWKAVGGTRVNVKWAVENWTVAPPDLPGHHGILLLEPDGRPVVGTRAGLPMGQSQMLEMAAPVRPALKGMQADGEASTKGLITTGANPIMVAAANVVPEPQDRTPETMRGPKRRLVLIHPINSQLLATMNETIGGEQLSLSGADQSENKVVLASKAGDPVALSWRSTNPGRAAMIRSLEVILPILSLVTIFLFYAMWSGFIAGRALKQAAMVDYLTQLPNRAAFSAELDRRVSTGSRFALVLIDLDHFKAVNDTFGHLTGDALLKEIGRILKKAASSTDVVARLGGDEFAILCDTCDAVDRLLLSLEIQLAFPMRINGDTIKTTASIGAAVAEPDMSPEDLVAAADRNLYANKHTRTTKNAAVKQYAINR